MSCPKRIEKKALYVFLLILHQTHMPKNCELRKVRGTISMFVTQHPEKYLEHSRYSISASE